MKNWFFNSGTLNTNYIEIKFNNIMSYIFLVNDSFNQNIIYSWDGMAIDGILLPRETQEIEIKASRIFLKGLADYRIWTARKIGRSIND